MDAKDLLPVGIEIDEPYEPQLQAVADLEEAAQLLDLEGRIVNKLRHSERELTVNIPLLRDDGSAATFTALRIQHISWRGPSMGAVSFSPTAHLSALRAAAMTSTWQCALLDLPFGGAAGALVCDPNSMSERELRSISRDYVYGLRGTIGRNLDVIMPGLGCNEQIMAWMLDGHAQTLGRMERGTITGMPAALSGLQCTTPPIAHGIIAILRYLLATRPAKTTDDRRSLAGQRVSIQGFGSVGSSIASALYESGALIVAVADVSGAVRNQNGLDIPALQNHTLSEGVVFGFPAAEPACNADILECNCDVLITAATERQITAATAERVKASMVVEASHSAVTHSAEESLTARGTVVVPEILSTAGSAIASFLEWNQADRISPFSRVELETEMERRMVAGCKAVFDCASSRGLSPRRAANLLAIDRIATELRLRQ
jgi:glutamate dehydrogenase (NAD(P)+)